MHHKAVITDSEQRTTGQGRTATMSDQAVRGQVLSLRGLQDYASERQVQTP